MKGRITTSNEYLRITMVKSPYIPNVISHDRVDKEERRYIISIPPQFVFLRRLVAIALSQKLLAPPRVNQT